MGMDEITGQRIDGQAWTRQAVRRGVRTVKGSRPMVRWYGTNHLKFLAREITNGSVLELTGDLSDTIESTIPGARMSAVAQQENGESLEVLLTVDMENLRIGV